MASEYPGNRLRLAPQLWNRVAIFLGRVHTSGWGFGMVGGWRLPKSNMIVWRVVFPPSAVT